MNHAEVWDNTLHGKFDHIHPELSDFLTKVQQFHYTDSIGARNVSAGRVPAIPRRQQDINHDRHIDLTKRNFEHALNNYWNQNLPLPQGEVFRYLDAIHYRLGNQMRCNELCYCKICCYSPGCTHKNG